VGGEIFHTCPEQLWGLLSLIYTGQEAISGVKAAGHGVDHPPHLATRLKKE